MLLSNHDNMPTKFQINQKTTTESPNEQKNKHPSKRKSLQHFLTRYAELKLYVIFACLYQRGWLKFVTRLRTITIPTPKASQCACKSAQMAADPRATHFFFSAIDVSELQHVSKAACMMLIKNGLALFRPQR